jgi:heme/copper-type cytochrome/quinol oxidase subunit 3
MAVTTTSTESMLALPSGERPPVNNLYNLGLLVGSISGLMLIGALVAAFVNVGHFTHPWPPKGVALSNYDGTMLVLTMLMSSVTVEWGIWAARRSMRGQAAAAFVLTIGFGVAFLNLAWFFGRRIGFGPSASPYAVLLFSMLAVTGVAVAVGVVTIIAVLARLLGNQVMSGRVELARSAGWFWQSIVVGWVIVYSTVWLFS